MSATSPPQSEKPETSFAETALKLGGKSEDEARRTGAIDRADDQVEQLFRPEYQTVNSPAHRAVWDRALPIELFQPTAETVPGDVQRAMDESLAVVRRHRDARTLLGSDNKASNQVLADLGKAGYWGLLVDREYGGTGASMRSFASFLTRMATIDPTIAGLASVHGCIGAVDPVRTFGDEEQKRRWLPKLASGERLSAFALTEPCAGSDLTALRTRAVREGNEYVVTGEKLFITNVVPGRTIGLVCLIDDKPAVLVVDLPDQENKQFQLVKYGLYALKHTHNQGIKFNGLRVPAENLLSAPKGSGLTIAYHGLNLGRVALCANAAGTMRIMLASMIPWAQFRRTYGEEIAKRELVRRRLARLAGLIVGADALVAWCSTLLDAGYRGEMECIVAKVFGSEALKEAAIELCMKTHGGRSFLHGHLFGDNVHEYLAPCIYEGEGEMLSMAFFKSLVKQHGTQFFEPVGQALGKAGIKRLNPLNPSHVWALRQALPPYLKWLLAETVRRKGPSRLPAMPETLRRHAAFAARALQRSPLEISGVMRKHQLKLADRQCRMNELSQRIQNLLTILCTSLYAARQGDEVIRAAADLLCQELTMKLTVLAPATDTFGRQTNSARRLRPEGSQLWMASIRARFSCSIDPAMLVPMTPDRLQSLLSTFPSLTIGLVGDLFLDRYLDIEPDVKELSIETNLEAYQVTRIRDFPGALGTVLNNLAALGVGKLVVATVIGDDGHGYDLLQSMRSLPVDTQSIVQDRQRLTPTYTKPMKQDAGGVWQELNRLDVRTREALSEASHRLLADNVRGMRDRVDGLIVLDQIVEENWGVVDQRMRGVLRDLTKCNSEKLVYSDSRAFLSEFDFGILKGNRTEYLRAAATLPSSAEIPLASVLEAFARRNGRPMFCTVGEEGMLVARANSPVTMVPAFPVPPPVDICGAGDAATSGIVASLLAGANELEAATVGNLVASITVQQLGTTGTATPEQVLKRYRESVGT